MGRKTLPDAKIQIAARVAPRIKAVIDAVVIAEKRTASQVVEILLEESPRVKAEIRKNGKKK
jgi:hypothetical protein